jgi:hypothetical protein
MKRHTFQTTHKLAFLAAEPEPGILGGVCTRFKVGTCHGLYTVEDGAYKIVAIINDSPGNGHFTDVLEWFQNSSHRDHKDLEAVEIWNDGLRKHLVAKRGFKLKTNGDCVLPYEACCT